VSLRTFRSSLWYQSRHYIQDNSIVTRSLHCGNQTKPQSRKPYIYHLLLSSPQHEFHIFPISRYSAPSCKPSSLSLARTENYSPLRHFVTELLEPLPISIVVALVDPLKALFLPPSADFQPRFWPVAPNRQPPLAFVLDMASLSYSLARA
jgi:hypothetical protein